MPLLELREISKHFGPIEALSGFNLILAPGEVLGLMGDNGAGKSTAVKIISGSFGPSSGELLLDEKPVAFESPLEARGAGIETVHQDLALCNNLSAAANVFLGKEITKSFGPFKILDYAAMVEQSTKLFAELKSEVRPKDAVRSMSGGQRQAVAIARALRSKAKLIIFDEPTAAISVRQVAEVLALIKRLKSQGVAVILISHRMPDVFEVCDRIVVLRRGRKVADKPASKTSPEEVTALITGALDAA